MPGSFAYSPNAVEAWSIIRDGFEFDHSSDCAGEGCVHSLRDDPDTIVIVRRGFLGEDVAKVTWKAGKLYISAEESGMLELSDWLNNFDWGNEEIKLSNGQAVGVGYDGFVKTANTMRSEVLDAMRTICSKHGQTLLQTKVVYTGYSRGGGLVQVFAFAHLTEGLVKSENAFLYTFGSPRALQTKEADYLHDALLNRAERYVEGSDPVPALPFSFMGLSYLHHDVSEDKYKHVGTVFAKKTERDYPKVLKPWGVLDHLTYGAKVANQENGQTPRSKL